SRNNFTNLTLIASRPPKPIGPVILFAAKNPSICGTKQIQRALVAFGSLMTAPEVLQQPASLGACPIKMIGLNRVAIEPSRIAAGPASGARGPRSRQPHRHSTDGRLGRDGRLQSQGKHDSPLEAIWTQWRQVDLGWRGGRGASRWARQLQSTQGGARYPGG